MESQKIIQMQKSSWGNRMRRFTGSPMFLKLGKVVAFFVVYSIMEIGFELYELGIDVEFPVGVHTLLGVALSILLVFRTNSTYDRWWEARKWWGALTNTSRSLAQVVSGLAISAEERKHFADLQSGLPYALRDRLREDTPPLENAPVMLVAQMSRFTQKWLNEQVVSPQQWSSLELRLSAFMDVIGACERIRRTPLPLSHRAAIPQALISYLLVLPWGLPNVWVSPLIVGVVTYFMMGLEFIAEDLEEPFGFDSDDLPLTTYADGINSSLDQIYRLAPGAS